MRGRILPRQELERSLAAAAVLLLALWPVIFNGHSYWVSYIFTQTFVMGIAASSLILLSAYGGMVSLVQVALYGISAYVLGNVVVKGEAKGLHLGWNPWFGVLLAIVITTAVALLFGAVAARSAGIYFLMITLTFGVIAFSFFLSVTLFGGFSERFFRACLRAIRETLQNIPASEATVLRRDLASYCNRIASVSGGFLGIGTISPEERFLLIQLAEEMEINHPCASRQALDELELKTPSV